MNIPKTMCALCRSLRSESTVKLFLGLLQTDIVFPFTVAVDITSISLLTSLLTNAS